MNGKSSICSGLRAWYPAAILALTLYLVYGSVASTGSLLLPKDPAASLLIFSALLFAIFFLEALEVSVIALYSRKELPLAAGSMANFLKGRQLVLILIVFVSAQAVASPELRLPFTGINIPPLLALPLFQWGFLGSLLVLWIGQLGGKVIASASPKAIMDMAPSKAFLKLSIMLGGTPVVAAADWFVRQTSGMLRISAEKQEDAISFEPNAYSSCAITSCAYDQA